MIQPRPAFERSGVLLFGGSNSRAVVAFARAMSACGTPFHVIARGPEDPIFRTAYAARVTSVREDEALTVIKLAAWVNDARERTPGIEWLIAPTSEYVNLWLLRERAAIERLGVTVPLVAESIYRKLTDKWSASRLFASHGIRVPRELDGFSGARLPLVAKPRENLGDDGRMRYPRLLRSAADLESFLGAGDVESYFPQELVVGSSHYLLLHRARSGEIAVASQRNLAQQADGKSIVMARSDSFHRDPVSHATVRLLEELGYHGLAMIEFIVDDAGPCFIEINPRAWGPIQLCLDHRTGILESFLGDALSGDPGRFLALWANRPAAARYGWLGGILDNRRRGLELHWCGNRRPGFRDRARAILQDVYFRRDSWRLTFSESPLNAP